MRIIFLDIDGPMIPARSYFMPGQTRPVTQFDPVAVSLLVRMANISGAKIVVHSSWRKPEISAWFDEANGGRFDLKEHLVSQGIPENLFHEDWVCEYTPNTSRWHDIKGWLRKHALDNITHYVILDDEKLTEEHKDLEPHLVVINFDEGLLLDRYLASLKILKIKDKQIGQFII